MDTHQPRHVTPQPPHGVGGGGGGFSAILTVFLSFIAIFAMIVIPSSSTFRNGFSVLHQVPEGHVGVYWRGGALLKTITDPGFHLKLPFITHYEPVQVTLQTDQVRDIPCGTKGGVMINFEKIEVVNRLHKDYVHDTLLNYGVQYDNTWIYDKIHHEINQFCSSHSLQQVYIDVFDQIDEKMKDALQGNDNSVKHNAPLLRFFVIATVIVAADGAAAKLAVRATMFSFAHSPGKLALPSRLHELQLQCTLLSFLKSA
ncbi:hypothetical protein CMV_012807 [Castanea mollissima]|uniref:Band 7 domain-containing protein n=1 Tax=Castanea mollissima TaxID=60419 RepID=A0A8J4VIT1_9ROSI|nr:hypothetical protein CMV_012807 [Castanea mollissima]